jgi:hypothetical protein
MKLPISLLALSAAGPFFAGGVDHPSPAEAACDEQLGEFQRDGTEVYCDIDGVLYEGTEEPQARAAASHSLDPQREQSEDRPRSGSPARRQTDRLTCTGNDNARVPSNLMEVAYCRPRR